MKKINIADKINTAIAYKGCVTVEYFDKINGKKVINAHNEGQTALFNAIVKMLEGRDINSISRPSSIGLFNAGGENVLNGSVKYLVTPVLYVAKKDTNGNYTYSSSNVETSANCIMYSFTIALNNYKTGITDNTVTTLKLLNAEGTELFATLDLTKMDQTIKIDTTSNMQIYWRLIFE